jgi:hypothetical protein
MRKKSDAVVRSLFAGYTLGGYFSTEINLFDLCFAALQYTWSWPV